jgi:hypothetical protein
MCGICGTFHYASNQPVAEAEIRGMMRFLSYRPSGELDPSSSPRSDPHAASAV